MCYGLNLGGGDLEGEDIGFKGDLLRDILQTQSRADIGSMGLMIVWVSGEIEVMRVWVSGDTRLVWFGFLGVPGFGDLGLKVFLCF